MDANQRESLNHLVEMAVGAAFEVSNVLGAGFLEKVYERAMVIELKHRGIKAEAQSPVNIRYKKESVVINFQHPKAEWKRVVLDF